MRWFGNVFNVLDFVLCMVEKVSTGGLVSFKYGKGQRPKMSSEEKKEIENAYGKYYERKRREKRNRIILIVVIAVVLLGFGVYFLIR